MYKLGLKPPNPESIRFKLSDFVDRSKLPTPPKSYGHENVIPQNHWFMLGNDEVGCCVFSGAAHEHMLWNSVNNRCFAVNTDAVLKDYSEVTGYVRGDKSTDQGTDASEAAKYRRKIGIRDSSGRRHQIAAYMRLREGNLDDLWVATYLFGAVGLCIQVPNTAMDQFGRGHPWDEVPGSKIDGYHYIPMVAKRNNLVCITWGKLQDMTERFVKANTVMALAYVTEEQITDGKSPEGFDYEKLNDCLRTLG